MSQSAYHLIQPDRRSTSVVFASPHSGRDYPPAFLHRTALDARQIRSSEDAFVDLLFAAAPDHGAPLLLAGAPRAFVDLNRGADELDPALIDGIRRRGHSARINSGLGVIPRVVANGQHIYQGKLSLAEAHQRITRYWRPYHDQLQTLLDESRNRFGNAILIDCHSMPREALDNVQTPGGGRPDIVLGDRFGATTRADIMDRVEAAFAAVGLNVARNMPFAGAYITQYYGQPTRNQHAIQVEINRGIYLNEKTMERTDGFDPLRATLSTVIAEIAAIGGPADRQLAAE